MDKRKGFQADRLYFAYGSNMDMEQMKKRCRGHELVAIAQLDGYQFRINGRGVATIVPHSGAVVHGVVWSISSGDEARLDRYEGVANGVYSKQTVQVTRSNGQRAEALVYVAADSSKGGSWNEYLNKIIKAAKQQGLPKEYIRELEEWTQNKRQYSEKEEEYLARLMEGGMDRTRAEWYLNAMQRWTHEEYEEYTKFHLKMMGSEEGEEK